MFQRPFRPDQGLGPLFNEDRCSSCHDLPAIGGTGVENELKATRYQDGRCQLFDSLGGPVFQERATGLLAARGIQRRPVPPAATGKARLVAPALFGLGLIEAIPERTIEDLADPADRNRDGISGRPALTESGRVGRFGHKADQPTLASFVASALQAEMGLTSPVQPRELPYDGLPLPAGVDPAADPEVPEDDLARLVAFVRFLAPPPPAVLASAAERDSVRRGERVFQALGCAACHRPLLRTGPSEIAALDRQRVPLYSDLLLHDMGRAMADICAPGAAPAEWRTAPLWGLRFRGRFLHDGRAATVSDAILLHGGEAEAARARFAALDYAAQRYLLKFLETR